MGLTCTNICTNIDGCRIYTSRCSVNIEIYFGDPGSPGQRGLNENSNGIVRKDLPKSTDLSVYSQEELNMIAYKWNSIPRKSLDYKTPNEVIKEATGFESLLTFA